MASHYVDSNATGAGTGADWANAYTTLVTALSGKAAGDVFYVAHDHAETAASAKSLSTPGTAAAPCYIYCVNKAGSVPPVSADLRTTATVSTTVTNSITFGGGYDYWYGITFSAGTGSGTVSIAIGSSAEGAHYFSACKHKLGSTGSANTIALGNTTASQSQRVVFDNTVVEFSATGQSIAKRNASFTWKNTPSAIVGATVPTNLFGVTNIMPGTITVSGVDLSAAGSGKTLVSALTARIDVAFVNCRFGTSVTVAAAAVSQSGSDVTVIACDDGSLNYRTERFQYSGFQIVETSIVRTGGASDGTTPVSWAITTTANSKRAFPYESLPMAIWNDTTGSAKTVTVYGIWGGGAVPNSDEIWIEASYLGSSSYPIASVVSSAPADLLAAGSALTSDSSTWGGSTTKFKMEVTLTPQMKGPITVTVKAAKAASTFYIDPLPVVS